MSGIPVTEDAANGSRPDQDLRLLTATRSIIPMLHRSRKIARKDRKMRSGLERLSSVCGMGVSWVTLLLQLI
jgi:hypothetical protein